MDACFSEENLVLQASTQITACVSTPTGSGARTPYVLLNETAHQLNDQPLLDFNQAITYDTYDGQNHASGLDWYAIEFAEPLTFNCIEVTMGFPYRDGGWWTSLQVDVRDQNGTWRAVRELTITPPYPFDDVRGERRPFETYALTFGDVTSAAVRIIGHGGGLAQFTSLARIAVYQRDLSRWNPLSLPEPPLPHLLRLLPPSMVWDLSEHLVKLTALTINFPLLEYYLDEHRYQHFWRRTRRNYEGEPDLWFLVGDAIGWDTWTRIATPAPSRLPTAAREPYVRQTFHDTLAYAVAPIVIDGAVLGEMTTSHVVVKDAFDWSWHQCYAAEHGLAWPSYLAAIERSPQMTMEQMEGAAGLLGMMVNTIANLAHHNTALERELAGASQRSSDQKVRMRQAVAFMQQHVEAPIDVADVARAVAMSPSYFCEVFTHHLGRTPSDFLIDLRLARAKEYLVHTDMSVIEVAVTLNYDPAYFSRLFKRRTGTTPGTYAKRMWAGHDPLP
jgi:AraC-like DNA-binding protein